MAVLTLLYFLLLLLSCGCSTETPYTATELQAPSAIMLPQSLLQLYLMVDTVPASHSIHAIAMVD
jgi:hypothetical protein